jgi:hypothetical protein
VHLFVPWQDTMTCNKLHGRSVVRGQEPESRAGMSNCRAGTIATQSVGRIGCVITPEKPKRDRHWKVAYRSA